MNSIVSIVVSVYSLLFETDLSNVIWNDSKVARIGCSIIIGYMIAGKVDNSFWTLYEISVLIASTRTEGSGEPVHMRRLTRVFASRTHKRWR